MHNPDQVLLGVTLSSIREVSFENADPAVFLAGLIVRRSGSGVSLSSGSPIGVSLGSSLSNTKDISVVRSGSDVPVRLKDEGAPGSAKIGDITFKAKVNGPSSLTVTLADTASGGTAVASVVGNAITISIEAGETDADTIEAAVLASAPVAALIETEIDSGAGSDAQAAAASTPLAGGADSYSYVVIGQKIKVGTDGLAASTGNTMEAKYVSQPKQGVNSYGQFVAECALVEITGGLI